MKNFPTQFRTLLGLALMGTMAVAPTLTPVADAAPRRNNAPRPAPPRNDGRDQTFTGTVSKVKNDREFDIRIGDRTYNVYSVSATRGLDRNDRVTVTGDRVGNNDIRNARVSVTRGR